MEPSTKKRKARNPGETAPRLNDGPKKEFEVTSATVWDSTGKKCKKGETALLTEPLARFFADRGKIRIPLQFESFDDDKEPVDEAGGSEAGADTAEVVDAPVVDAAGSEPSGEPDGAAASTDEGGDKPRRRQSRSKAL